ncbi:hypothetical protein ACVWWO_005227 [Bradyrhizobium sp. F1.13.1]
MMNDRSTCPLCALAAATNPDRPRQPSPGRLYCRDVLLDMRDRQPAVKGATFSAWLQHGRFSMNCMFKEFSWLRFRYRRPE